MMVLCDSTREGYKRVTIVSAYNASLTTGDTTNFRQQQRVLTHIHQLHKQTVQALPRRQFILDLHPWLEHLIQADHDIILAMDADSTHDPDTSCSPHPLSYKEGIPTIDKQHNGTLATSVSSCSLVDPLARQHSTPFPASRIRGLEHIDFILFTPCIASGCLSFHSLFNSDHRPYFLDLNAMTLFSVPAYEIQPALHRHLRLNDP